eukprot:CAMPEP_0172624480 /NCGR_PEP_ID=MMETSP1068-20121228/136962_1 /TAXON_ID=35684 /ORGANISM="Pseudopedinella elastica, Strain CCMP716" /LENGTH=254 /DNA_ID=CAMNT_0013433455 /DNA_START=213 /DNA_END=977 /DNA_ORIENTATION=+
MAPPDQAWLAASAAGNLALMERYLFPSDSKRRAAQRDFCDERGCSALTLATRNGRQDAVAWLVSVGCNVDLQDSSGCTALMHSVLGDQCACGSTLVEAEADLNLLDLTGKSAMIHAVTRTGKAAQFFLELLIAAGGDVDIRDDAKGWTALHWAMYKRHFGHMNTLVSAGADLDVQDSQGRTPLMVGVLGYDEAAPTIPGIKLLIKNGADMSIREEDNCTATDLAFLHKKQPCLEVLEAAGAAVTKWRDTRKSAS